jgi:hypothetical protein
MRTGMMVATISLTLTGAAAAKPALRDVPEIDNGLFVVGLAHEIRENCPSIEARLLKAIGVLRGLEREARSRGYSEDEIRRHLKSKTEKKRLRARAASYMKARGFGQTTDGYCALGQSEIARDSEIGALLRAYR